MIAGVDEAGRGAWAGPVVASAVIFLTKNIPKVADSKILSAKDRERLFGEIMEMSCVGVGIVSHEVIDSKGIRKATHMAMQNAVDGLSQIPGKLLIDGRDNFQFLLPHEYFVRGDTYINEISAASIIAKVTRDRLMIEYGDKFENYGFAQHKGYGTKVHQTALKMYGPCGIHRRSYRPIGNLLQLGILTT